MKNKIFSLFVCMILVGILSGCGEEVVIKSPDQSPKYSIEENGKISGYVKLPDGKILYTVKTDECTIVVGTNDGTVGYASAALSVTKLYCNDEDK